VTEIYATGDKKTVGTGLICYLKSSGAKCERFETTVEGHFQPLPLLPGPAPWRRLPADLETKAGKWSERVLGLETAKINLCTLDG
jgi:hypothetical protein